MEQQMLGKWSAGVGKEVRKIRGKERRAGLDHMLVSCVNWRSLLLLMFPLKKGDIYRRLALQLMDPCSGAPTKIRIIIIAYAKNGKMPATWEVFRDIKCACAVSLCQLVSLHIHKKASAGENRSFFWKESEDRTREKEQKNGKTALYWGL